MYWLTAPADIKRRYSIAERNDIMSTPSIYEYGGEPVTTSRAVAEQFGKQHKNVIRNIESIIVELNQFKTEPVNGGELKIEPSLTESRDFAARNFFLTEYTMQQQHGRAPGINNYTIVGNRI